MGLGAGPGVGGAGGPAGTPTAPGPRDVWTPPCAGGLGRDQGGAAGQPASRTESHRHGRHPSRGL